MNILNSKNILITCIMSLCSIGISFPFHGWSLDNSMWNWTCYFFIISEGVSKHKIIKEKDSLYVFILAYNESLFFE